MRDPRPCLGSIYLTAYDKEGFRFLGLNLEMNFLDLARTECFALSFGTALVFMVEP